MAKTLRDLVAATVLSKVDIGLVGQGVTDKSMSLDILAEFILRLSDQGFKAESVSVTTSVSAIEAQQIVYEGDTTAGDIVLTLPFSGPRDGTKAIITNFTGSNDLTLTYASGVDIVLPPGGWVMAVYQGEWQILSNNIQLISKIPVGIAPLQVVSTTVVPNLNADKIDGADLSTDGTMADDSAAKVPSESAIKTFKSLIIPFATAIDKTVLDTEKYTHYILTGAAANKTFTLPTVADNINKDFILWNDDPTYMLTVDGEDSETIDGMLTIQLPKQGNYIHIIGTSSGWKIIGESITSQLRLNTYAGYGSADTRILKFTNLERFDGNMFSHNHGSYGTKGLEIVLNRRGKYSAVLTAASNSTVWIQLGLSLNSSQLTTSIHSINTSDRMSAQGTPDFIHMNITGLDSLVKNDVIRPHGDGNVPGGNVMRLIVTYLGQ